MSTVVVHNHQFTVCSTQFCRDSVNDGLGDMGMGDRDHFEEDGIVRLASSVARVLLASDLVRRIALAALRIG